MEKTGKILIVDGHGLAFRAFYAVPPLSAPDGTPTNAITGFMNMLARVEEDLSPGCCAVVFDAPGPTFRHEAFPQYKEQRRPTPEEFKPQVPLLRELLERMGYPVLSVEGVEADDVIASLALTAVGAGRRAVILSSDKDLQQVLGEGVTMMRPMKGITTLAEYNAAAFERDHGFPPESVPDYLALLGDAADNVPGVPGVGEKTALQLIGQWRNLERLFASLDEVRPSVRKKLEAGRDSAFRSRELIRLRLDVPVELDVCLSAVPEPERALSLCARLGLSKLAERLKRKVWNAEGKRAGTEGEAPPVRGVPVPLEALMGAEAVGVVLLDGGEGAGKKEEPRFQAAVSDGRFAEGGLPDLERLLTSGVRTALTDDCKTLMGRFDVPFGTVRVWDLKTAHYLLHPDLASHAPSTLLPLLPGETPPALRLLETARGLDAEIDRYEGLRTVMEELDLPLLPVLVAMERAGVRLDFERFESLHSELEARIAAIEGEIAEQAGEAVNLNSPKQVAELLFERLGLPSGARTRGKTAFSTSASVLEGLAALPNGGVPRLILEHRELSKMLSGFVVPLRRSAELGGGIVHTTFEAAFTGTGRLSSRDPNLQNLPAFGHWAERIKEGLIPVGEGNVFVAADYSQVELRVLAHFSQEPRLIEAFRRGVDIHRETASWVFGVEPDFVTPELRRVAKMVNFGLLYGMSAFGLAERLGVDRGEAAGIVRRYFDALPGVGRYLEESAAQARALGYARTLDGRIRPVAEAAEGVRDRNGLNRILVNTPIQGTAADIARRAMVAFARRFAGDGAVRLFLQVHDSLVCECPAGRAEEVGAALSEVMKGAGRLSVPLETDLKVGRSLAET